MGDEQFWRAIEKNIVEFNKDLSNKDYHAVKHFSSFAHWYYHPGLDLFGPSKFIGYANTTLESYSGRGHGGQTQEILQKYFDPVYGQENYSFYLKKLLDLADKHNLKICKKTVTGNCGWIYLPKRKILGKFINPTFLIENDILSFEEEFEELTQNEGKKINRLVNTYERNPKLRKQAIDFHGVTCKVCGFNFEKTYGSHGKGFIEVHHLVPLSKIQNEHSINPLTDMIVLCANCHRMIHRYKNTPLSIEDLKRKIKR